MILAFICFHTFETETGCPCTEISLKRISIKLYSNENDYRLILYRQWVINIGKLFNQYNSSS